MKRTRVLAAALALSAAVPAAGASSWTSAGSMATARSGHTATLLPNGKVLVAGGYGPGTAPLASAELYDPVTRTWAATGSMTVPRAAFTATLLASGLVLVVGGFDANGYGLATAELYNPASGQWTRTGSPRGAHARHTATMLTWSGKVLIAGGRPYGWSSAYTNNLATAAVELYDPATGTWSPGTSLTTARYAHTATLVPGTTEVLFAGGWGSAGPIGTYEVHDVAAGTVKVSGWTLADKRSDHTAAVLAPGVVLLAGGYNGTSGSTSAELYFSETRATWAPTSAVLATGRYGHTATVLPSGRVLVAGGVWSASALGSAEVYEPADDTWLGTASMAVVRSGHTATALPSGGVLIAGGVGPGARLATAELYYDRSLSAWEDWSSSKGALPWNAVPAGWVVDTGACYACSARHFSGTWNTHPGKLCSYRGLWTCFIGNGGREEIYDQYKVLVGNRNAFTWTARTSASSPPANATWGGWVIDSGDCYVCRAYHYGAGAWNQHVGKLCQSLGRWSCFIGNGGVEQRYESYDVMLDVQ